MWLATNLHVSKDAVKYYQFKGDKIKLLNIFISIVFFTLPLSAADFKSLTKLTLKTSPILQKLSLQTKIANEEITLANAGFYPTLQIGANMQYSKKFYNTNTPSSVGENSLTQDTYYQSSSTISLTYDLFRFGGTSYSVKAAYAKYNATKYEECEQKKQLIAKLLDVYYKVRIQQLRKKYHTTINKNYLHIYKISKRLNSSGILPFTQVQEYAKKIADNLNDLESIDKLYQESLRELAYISGAKLSNLNNLAPIRSNQIPIDTLSFEQSEKYKKAKNTIEQKQAQYNETFSKYLPSLSIYGKYDFYGQDKYNLNSAVDDLERNGYRVGLSLSWTLFDGFSREATRSIRLMELQQAKLDMNIAKKEYEKEKDGLNKSRQIIKNMLQHAKSSKDISKDISKMSNRLFESGEADKLNEIKSTILNLEASLKTEETNEKLNKNYQEQAIRFKEGYICEVP